MMVARICGGSVYGGPRAAFTLAKVRPPVHESDGSTDLGRVGLSWLVKASPQTHL
jgi:hypothetical protein